MMHTAAASALARISVKAVRRVQPDMVCTVDAPAADIVTEPAPDAFGGHHCAFTALLWISAAASMQSERMLMRFPCLHQPLWIFILNKNQE